MLVMNSPALLNLPFIFTFFNFSCFQQLLGELNEVTIRINILGSVKAQMWTPILETDHQASLCPGQTRCGPIAPSP